MKHLIISLAALSAAASLGAQSLNKEITVERDIVPDRREATRLGFTPAVTLRPLTMRQLTYSRNSVTAPVTPAVTVLDPAAYADSIYTSPYDGYAALSLGNMFNPALSAGYRFINTSATRLGAFIQYDGPLYRDKVSYGADANANSFNRYFRRHDITAALTLRQNVGAASALDLDVDYTFTRLNTPEYTAWDAPRMYWQNVHRLNTSALWHSTVNDLYYRIGAGFSRFAFVDTPHYKELLHDSWYTLRMDPAKMRPMRQNLLAIKGAIGADLGSGSLAELDVDFSALSNSHQSYLTDMTLIEPGVGSVIDAIKPGDAQNTWLLRLTPRYRYTSGITTLDLGARVDLTHGSGKVFHIAPDVTVGITPSDRFAVTLRAGGGEVQNTLASLFAVNPYMTPLFSYTNSHVPLTVDANITIGPFSGAYLELFGGYAAANEWLMPSQGNFLACDVRGWHAGAAVGYRYGSIVDARVAFEAAPHKSDRFYYLWRDRAGKVLTADLTLRPLRPLDIKIGYEFRGSRMGEAQSLHPVSDLSLDASWAFTPQFTAFVGGANLLNRSYRLVGDIPAQGINARIGAAYKF